MARGDMTKLYDRPRLGLPNFRPEEQDSFITLVIPTPHTNTRFLLLTIFSKKCFFFSRSQVITCAKAVGLGKAGLRQQNRGLLSRQDQT